MLPPLRANDIRNAADLASHYRQYLRVLNQGTLDLLHLFVARAVKYNDKTVSLNAYSTLIPKSANVYPHDIVTDVSARTVAARLHVEVPASSVANGGTDSPSSNGVESYTQFVFYRFDEHWHISQVWTADLNRTPSNSNGNGGSNGTTATVRKAAPRGLA